MRLLAGVVLVVAAPRRQLGRLAVGPLQPLQPLAVAAVGGGGGAQGVRHLPRPHLARHARHLLVLGPPRRGRHGAGLRGEVDRRGLVRPVHLVRPLPRPRLGPGVRLVARLALLAQGEQLLDGLGTGGACKGVAECDYTTTVYCVQAWICTICSMQLSTGLATHRTCWAPGRGSCRPAACPPRARGRSSARAWSWSCSPRSGSGSGSASAPAQDSVTS